MHYLASDGALKDIDTNLRLDVSSPNRLDKSGAYYIIDSGLYNVAFAAASGQGAYDVAYEVPRPVQPKFFDPGKLPAPVTRIRWKILSYGYFDRQRSTYQILEYARSVKSVISSDQQQATSNQIDYPQIFNNIVVRYTCGNTSLKEEIVLSQSARSTLPDPAKFNLSRANTYFVVAMEFLLTPNNINVFARRQGAKMPIKQGNDFNFDGDEPIEFEDEHTTLHFFFPKDYAHAVADSVTGFTNRLSIKRVFYSQGGKNYMLVGVPWSWVNSAPTGDLIIDPTTTVTNSDDTYLQDATNFGTNTSLVIGKSSGSFKKRTIIKFNISGVPSYATVLNAQMKLRYYGTSGTPWIDRWVQAHQLLRHWRELEADSLKRRNGSNWLTPRGKIGPGSDSTLVDANGQFESTILFKDLEYPAWKSWDLSALTQKWITSAATNYGVILWATNEDNNGMNLFFRSSEYTTDPTMQPKLEIIWSQLPRTVYFLKDHLGSIRATVQDTSTAPVVGYDDYDPWGYILAGRSLIASGWGSQAGIVKNKFTGKEWDDEFGLNLYHFDWRPYDPLIGRWMVKDPLVEKYPNWSPYVYTLNNPVVLIDPNGKEPLKARIAENLSRVLDYINSRSGNAGDVLSGSVPLPGNAGRLFRGADKLFVATQSGFIIDMEHFIGAAATTYALSGNAGGKIGGIAKVTAAGITQLLGLGLEFSSINGNSPLIRASAFSEEDLPSNLLGSQFALFVDPTEPLGPQVLEFLLTMGAITKDEYAKLYKEKFDQLPNDERELEERQKQKEEEARKRRLERLREWKR